MVDRTSTHLENLNSLLEGILGCCWCHASDRETKGRMHTPCSMSSLCGSSKEMRERPGNGERGWVLWRHSFILLSATNQQSSSTHSLTAIPTMKRLLSCQSFNSPKDPVALPSSRPKGCLDRKDCSAHTSPPSTSVVSLPSCCGDQLQLPLKQTLLILGGEPSIDRLWTTTYCTSSD